MLSKETDTLYRKELQFLVDNQIPCDKVKSLNAVLDVYREKLQLCRKIETQNKNLKGKYADLE